MISSASSKYRAQAWACLAVGALLVACSSDDVAPPGPVGAAAGTSSTQAGTGGVGGGAAGVAGTGGALTAAGTGGQSAGGSGGGATAGSGGISTGGVGGAGGAGASAGGSSGGMAVGGGGAATGGAANMPSTGCNKPRTLQDGERTLQSGGAERKYVLRVPADYDSARPYRLMLGFHGAGGKGSDVKQFGLWDLAAGSTIFAAPSATGGIWNATTDTAMVSDLLKELEGQLCIDLSRVELEGFSQGGAMVWTLACALPDTFRLAIVHSGGGLPMPKTCKPIPFLSALGNDGSGQGMSSDFFAMTNGCTVKTMPLPPAGGHVCTDYEGCDTGYPTRWCDYDGGHDAAPSDKGASKSWVPEEVWKFVAKF